MKQLGGRSVWSVSEVTLAVWRRFEDVPSVWVEAEITNLNRRGSQVYFTLVDHSDEPHMIDASMNAIVYDRLASRPQNGTLVHAYGRVEYWRARSQVRLRIERLELTGDGLLLARIDELKRRLAAEGLTADARKRPLPRFPRRIGLVTGAEGAARADFLKNVGLRYPAAQILVVNSLVQGEAAPRELVRAIRHLDAIHDVDVIVLARGGGALEDLMAFNSEAVCRAVADAKTPVVSAVGHETDVTLCDLVADLRVSTPTKAAEAVVPEAAAVVAALARHDAALAGGLRRRLNDARRSTAAAASRLQHGLRTRGRLAATHSESLGARLTPALRRVAAAAPAALALAGAELDRAVRAQVAGRTLRVDQLAALHELLSPDRTVSRGYAIVRTLPDRRIVASASSLRVADRAEIRLRDGTVETTVTARGDTRE